MEATKNCAVYLPDFAVKYGEKEAYLAAYNRNVDCKEYIEKAIGSNYEDNRLNARNVVDAALKQFGYERVRYVLAYSVQRKGSYDRRLSKANVEWARDVFSVTGAGPTGRDITPYLEIDSCNPGLLDLVVTAFRKEDER